MAGGRGAWSSRRPRGGTNRFEYPRGPALPERGVGQWVDVCCSLSTQGRPTMRAALTAALSHEPRDGLKLNEERSVRRWL